MAEFIQASINDAFTEPDIAKRDIIATCAVERKSDSFAYPIGSLIIGDILGVDRPDVPQPSMTLGNVVHYSESDEHVRTILAIHDMERIPLSAITEPFITYSLRHGSCMGNSWHKDHFPSTD